MDKTRCVYVRVDCEPTENALCGYIHTVCYHYAHPTSREGPCLVMQS